MRTVLSRINGLFSMICGWLMFILMILLVLDFAGRGVPSTLLWLGEFMGSQTIRDLSGAAWLQPISWLTDFSVFLMIIAVYLGLALCEQRGQHVRIELLDSYLKGRPQQWLDLLVAALQQLTVILMMWAMYRNTLRSVRADESVSGLVPLAVWPVKIFVCAGIALYLIQVTVTLYDKCRVLTAPLPPEKLEQE